MTGKPATAFKIRRRYGIFSRFSIAENRIVQCKELWLRICESLAISYKRVKLFAHLRLTKQGCTGGWGPTVAPVAAVTAVSGYGLLDCFDFGFMCFEKLIKSNKWPAESKFISH